MKNTLRKILSSVCLSAILIGGGTVLVSTQSGCKSTPQQIAGKTLLSVQRASVAGLELYGAAYRRGEIDAETRAKVLDLYTKYQAAWAAAAKAAQFNYETPATDEVVALVTEFIKLVNTLRK